MSGRRRFGAIRKLPSGRWQVRFRDPTTHQLRTAPFTFGTKTDAGRWLSVLEADSLRGVWIDPNQGQMLFAELAERWFATKIHLRDNTKLHYEHNLRKHLLPFFAATGLSAPSPCSTCRPGSPTVTPTAGWHRTAWPRPTRSSAWSWTSPSRPASSSARPAG